MQQRSQGRRRLGINPHNRQTASSSLARVILGTKNAEIVPRPDDPVPPDASSHYYYEEALRQEFGGIVPFLIRFVRATLKVVFWITQGSCSYAVFYRWVMPNQVYSAAFGFDYVDSKHTVCITNSTAMIDAIRPLHKFERAPLDTTWKPQANLDLFAKHNHWEPIHADVIPTPKATQRIMQSRQQYYIDLALELPESNKNINAGVFGLVVELASSTNRTTLALSRMSARFPHESAWISNVRKIILLPWLLLGTMDESRTIYMSPFRHFTESLGFPLQYVTVRIVSRGQDNEVEVTRGFLTIGDEMSRMQEVLKEWYYTSFLCGTLLFACIDFMFWKAFCAGWKALSNQYFAMQEPACDLDLEDEDEFLDASLNEFANFDDYMPNHTQENFQDTRGSAGGEEEGVDDRTTFEASTHPSPGPDRVDVSSQDSWEDM